MYVTARGGEQTCCFPDQALFGQSASRPAHDHFGQILDDGTVLVASMHGSSVTVNALSADIRTG